MDDCRKSQTLDSLPGKAGGLPILIIAMIVVADASPLVALAACDCLDVLEKLFGEVKVSDAGSKFQVQ